MHVGESSLNYEDVGGPQLAMDTLLEEIRAQ